MTTARKRTATTSGPRPSRGAAAAAGVEWIAAQLQSPVTVGSGSAAYRPEMLLWTEAFSGLVLAVEMVDPKDGSPPSGKVLQRLLSRRPHPEAASRPVRIRVESEALARELRQVTDIPVVVAPTPEVAEIMASMIEHFDETEAGVDSSYLQEGAIAEPTMAELFESAAALWQAAPWRYLWDGDIIRVDAPALGIDGAVLCVMGGAKQCYGVLLFPSFVDYSRFVEAAETAGTRGASARPDFGATWLSLDFEPKSELPPGMPAEVKQHGWTLAAANAYPVVARHDRHGLYLPPSERDVLSMAVVAGAVVPFLAENRAIFRDELDEAVSESLDNGAGLEVRFTFPYEALDELQREEAAKAERPRLLSLVPPPVSTTKPRAARNAACPCGSGEKYKKCCLGADEVKAAASDPAKLHAIDARLVPQVYRFAEKRFGMGLEELSGGVFANPYEARQLSGPWSLYGRLINGKTAAEWFVEEHRQALSAEEQAWLVAQARAHLSLWEVTDVEAGHSITARDLLTGDTRVIREVMGSQTLRRRDTLLARVVTMNELSVLTGSHPRVLPPVPAAMVLDEVRRKLRKKGIVAAERLHDEKIARAMVHHWENVLAQEDERAALPPVLQNTDGDPMLWTTDHFDLAADARAEVVAQIATIEDMQREGDGAFVLLRRVNAKVSHLDNTLVGRVELSDNRVKAETNSIKRADALRVRLEKACGGLVRFRMRTHTDPMSQAHEHGADRAVDEAPPPEVVAALREMQAQHLAAWPDQPLPALRGKTPRQATKTRSGRETVELLVRDWEHHLARLPEAERMDLSSLRTELGLGR